VCASGNSIPLIYRVGCTQGQTTTIWLKQSGSSTSMSATIPALMLWPSPLEMASTLSHEGKLCDRKLAVSTTSDQADVIIANRTYFDGQMRNRTMEVGKLMNASPLFVDVLVPVCTSVPSRSCKVKCKLFERRICGSPSCLMFSSIFNFLQCTDTVCLWSLYLLPDLYRVMRLCKEWGAPTSCSGSSWSAKWHSSQVSYRK
jgi:hypothetical protein